MKRLFIIILVFTVISCSGQKESPEDFNIFYKKYFKDSKFQSKRRIFPCTNIYFNIDNMDTVEYKTNLIFKNKAKNHTFDINEEIHLVNIKKINNSILILNISGREMGLNIEYYFKLKRNRWFLFKIIDHST